MATFKARKVVAALPAQLEADTLYAVRVGDGFDLYISDNTGALAHKVNGGGGGATDEFIYLNADFALTSTTSTQRLFNTTTNGRLTLTTGIYSFALGAYLTGMSSTSGNLNFDLKGAGTAVLDGIAMSAYGQDGNWLDSNGGAAITGNFVRAAFFPRPIMAGIGTEAWFSANGVFRVTSAGTIIPSVVLDNAAAAVAKKGCMFRVRRLAAGSALASQGWN